MTPSGESDSEPLRVVTVQVRHGVPGQTWAWQLAETDLETVLIKTAKLALDYGAKLGDGGAGSPPIQIEIRVIP